ncbi:MAG TPA: hypothetical protein VNX21_05045 [Candidatus Thermoplasmatota archaeon]|nr:hypothetical protein [Candidatus Thermoplasmatota archaeon]
MSSSARAPPPYRRFDLVRCDDCGEAQMADRRYAVCPRCLGTSFHRVTAGASLPRTGWA